MKTLFIEARSNLDIKKLMKKVKFKGKLGLVSTVQHVHKLKEARKLLPKSVIGGQVLGCNVEKAKAIAEKIDGFLFIGSGMFHPTRIAMETGKKVLAANPFSGKVSKVSRKKTAEIKRKLKGAYLSFLHAEKLGILVSTKKGQNRLVDAKKLKAKLQKKEKSAYIFLFDTLVFSELENFPDIDCWINTACPRIAVDDHSRFQRPVINIDDLDALP